MTQRPSRPVRVLASALAAGALLTTAACSDGDDSGADGADTTRISSSPLAQESPAALTPAGARAALVTEGDLEGDWDQVKDAADWRDSLLVGKVDVADFLTAKTNAADCQKFLDALYSDDLLGKPSGASALTGFEEGDSRLLYQVAAYDRKALSGSLAWLKSLPVTCDQFTATDSSGGKRTVQVTERSLPKEGDARQGLRVTVQGTSGGAATTLTLDVAALRVGTDAITITNGGLDGVDGDSTDTAAELGTGRLEQVQAGRTPSANPGDTD
ncbi:hypothetical protein ACFYZI_10690 [Streptomyces griseorubiginosus]|uniref:Lipoprotein n=1 Tax=Streptomyces griseorubiginosus TaxID=67304 RepID=A0AAI8KY45_9ACTN|nr:MULTISPECIES: hypothetical protein [Streptomyces]AYC37694.1 hypothetical protein DWG14_01912 [Streptomyces griseorubiginosus]KUM78633.1 hypothetical protein AQI84_06350 [Streptomyces griseorubiginosus]TCR22685.1 hypothetical protein EV578_10415 [Streptomyces sp. BK205]